MRSPLRLLAIPLLLAASAMPALGDVRDKAGMFSPEAVQKADAELTRVERETGVPVTIETIKSLDGTPIDKAHIELGRREGIKGLFLLIAAREHKIEAGASREYDPYFSRPLYNEIYEAFMPEFKRNNYDAGLAAGVAKIESVLRTLKAQHGSLTPVPARAAARQPARGQAPLPGPRMPAQARSGLSTLIGIVLLVLGVVIVFRLLGALFGAARGGYGQGYGPGPMRGPGYGPGYGPGGGGGGGGFMSSLFGGLGGAMAGNWLYDQFSGRHHQYDQTGAIPPAEGGAVPTDTGNDWGANAGDGGGDWGGGDAGGGGGDWGGGGGGGDWGGGGGGDWGGGGGDGGSW